MCLILHFCQHFCKGGILPDLYVAQPFPAGQILNTLPAKRKAISLQLLQQFFQRIISPGVSSLRAIRYFVAFSNYKAGVKFWNDHYSAIVNKV